MPRPQKTVADYLVIAISPLLIMVLVGSLCFFLIEVFSRSEGVGGLRWLMFWFVMAVVLVSRIGVEQGTAQALMYGAGLATATWLYLLTVSPAYVLGLILLALVWWCAHRLTMDCTLIDEDEDASGSGLVQTVGDTQRLPWWRRKLGKKAAPQTPAPKKGASPHPPGFWVIYFSLAALPLFGLGQMLLPAGDLAAQHDGFKLLFLYVLSAVGLLLTTSFLGLRRYLRQRDLPMPAAVALGWVRFGAGITGFVLVGALLLPRPGVHATWLALRDQVDHRLRQASDYAMKFNPHGTGQGRPNNGTTGTQPSENPAPGTQPPNQPPKESSQSPEQNQSPSQNTEHPGTPNHPPVSNPAEGWYRLFKILFIIAVIVLVAWWVFWKRVLLFQIAQSLFSAVSEFFKNLFRFGSSEKTQVAASGKTAPRRSAFAAYQNPFLTGQQNAWSPEQLILYSFEALQAWAGEHGVEPRPEQTAREFCIEVGQQFPEITEELGRLSRLYGQAAFRAAVPANSDLEPLHRIWQFIGS